MQEKSNRSNRLKLWPLLFTLMIAAFCFALMGPILRGRTSFSHVFGEENGIFTNKKPTKPTKKPSSSRSSLAKTGDPTNIASVVAIAVAGAVALGYGVRRRRRQQ